ncbi:DUF2071 domain-containing protein [Fimbriiglobus ruber]|uniref:DUF2071 domain-containing protein n=1 Tax=Fimbriiglobus ruber TaxID=1908690 RepID=A0A225DVW0_9BACT|nr:DUF2071 domain-containing protein [Fimbriiglobus ruber]OWK45680.1 hypothetical protein FRUB_02011 [Fimbriiglobus ruber]
MADHLAFTSELLTRPPVAGWDVEASLEHFAIVSYAVPPQRVRPHVYPGFDLDYFPGPNGDPLVWVSMVPFEDQDFRFVAVPWLRFRFGQTNYRTYVIDRSTGRRAVWFFGTTLDSWTVTIPRHAWKLPWHRGRVRFDCAFDSQAGRYTAYRMATRATWGPVELELEDSGVPVSVIPGYADLEAGLVALTHPLVGVYYRRDGRLGTYRIWHDRLRCTSGRVIRARIGLFDRLGLVPYSEQACPHSVLLQHRTEFTIYLPPGRYQAAG